LLVSRIAAITRMPLLAKPTGLVARPDGRYSQLRGLTDHSRSDDHSDIDRMLRAVVMDVNMLKKVLLIGVVAASTTLGTAGMAYADTGAHTGMLSASSSVNTNQGPSSGHSENGSTGVGHSENGSSGIGHSEGGGGGGSGSGTGSGTGH
jgi:hypothetical protein